jgi:hypothetical protein
LELNRTIFVLTDGAGIFYNSEDNHVEDGMRKMPVVLLVAVVCVFSNALGLCQQSGSTNIAGGRGGQEFADVEPSAGSRVSEVRIKCGDMIDSVQMVYAPAQGRGFTGDLHGGPGGRLNVFRLDPDEYIIAISGRYGSSIDSLRIQTNKKISPLYGGSGGEREYRVEVPNGTQAIGFTGRAEELLDAIGLTYIPIPRRRGGLFGESAGQYEMTNLAGGRGGRPFSDQDVPLGARITEIRVAGGDRIDSVQVVYMLPNGRVTAGEQHGGGGGRQRVFRLDRDEYVIGIFGRMGEGIDSLGIQTNRRASPIFGGNGGSRDYRINVPSGCTAVGFAGRASQYIDAIGLTFARITGRR